MSQDNIKEIKRKAQKAYKILNFVFYGAIIFFVILLILNIIVSFMPLKSFKLTKGVRAWSVVVDLTAKHSLDWKVPFTILQPLSLDMINAKSAYLTFSFAYMFTIFPAFIYGAMQLRHILFSIANDETPFKMENIRAFRKLAYVIIGYSLIASSLISILGCILVTGIFSLTFSIKLSGIFAGMLILLLSEIFKYGIYLQYEYDTTL